MVILQHAHQNNTSLKNIVFQTAEELPTNLQFFVKDAIDQISKEFEKID